MERFEWPPVAILLILQNSEQKKPIDPYICWVKVFFTGESNVSRRPYRDSVVSETLKRYVTNYRECGAGILEMKRFRNHSVFFLASWSGIEIELEQRSGCGIKIEFGSFSLQWNRNGMEMKCLVVPVVVLVFSPPRTGTVMAKSQVGTKNGLFLSGVHQQWSNRVHHRHHTRCVLELKEVTIAACLPAT